MRNPRHFWRGCQELARSFTAGTGGRDSSSGPDTGGLSGATPGEAVSWGKVDPEKLPDAVVVYCDSTIALPLLTQYVLAKGIRRQPKRLYERLPDFLQLLTDRFAEMKEERIREGAFELG